MNKLAFYTVVLDGIDKCGKDTVMKYIWRLDKRLIIICRGWPSSVVYAKKFKRDCAYELPYKNALYVHLTVDKNDWQIRCAIHNEPTIDYSTDSAMFDDAFKTLSNYDYNVVKYNTSEMTAYQIAKQIVEIIRHLNGELDNYV